MYIHRNIVIARYCKFKPRTLPLSTREMVIFEEQYLSNPSDNSQADWCV